MPSWKNRHFPMTVLLVSMGNSLVVAAASADCGVAASAQKDFSANSPPPYG
jgi:hypothetical protein